MAACHLRRFSASSLTSLAQSRLGKGCITREIIAPQPLVRLANAIPGGWDENGTARGENIRSTAHWLYHLGMDQVNEDAPFAQMGPDGNPVLIEGYRRMWAGGSFIFHKPIKVFDEVEKESEITSLEEKTSGIYGDVLFLTRTESLTVGGKLCLEEKKQHVYLPNEGYKPPLQDTPGPAGDPPQWKQEVRADPVSLFRYSALTWNSHRGSHLYILHFICWPATGPSPRI
jgi:3-methylfumaryl-CoA hydratase